MGHRAACTCLAGLDLALKWATRGPNMEAARNASLVAQSCNHRCECPYQNECQSRLSAIDLLLNETTAVPVHH